MYIYSTSFIHTYDARLPYHESLPHIKSLITQAHRVTEVPLEQVDEFFVNLNN